MPAPDAAQTAAAIVEVIGLEQRQLGDERSPPLLDEPDSFKCPFVAYRPNSRDGTLVQLRSSNVETFRPATFRTLRSLLGVSEDDYRTDWRIEQLTAKKGTGKSGALFATSLSRRFMLKTIKPKEKDTLLAFLPTYLDYAMANPNSLIMRLVGFYDVTIGFSTVHVLVFGNVLHRAPNGNVGELFDLKGRKPKPTHITGDSHGMTISDNTLGSRKFNVEPELGRKLISQLVRDVKFLASRNLMDYSLLVGVNRVGASAVEHGVISSEGEESCASARASPVGSVFQHGVKSASASSEIYYFGIIDCLTDYSKRKKIAHCCKTCFRFRAEFLSTIPAPEFAERFLGLMNRVFPMHLLDHLRRESLVHMLVPEIDFEREGSTESKPGSRPMTPMQSPMRASPRGMLLEDSYAL
jgi:1-phosphatidylinositol-4-phosphate 5-kinase